MAKQSFTTGQVLTAAQMTSLQQTAMLGGAASAKTASYTLEAADAGTAISMNSASATTITVNTALFAAGDTVQITNLGAGVCTITAGTATVNTSASLALAQYESGTLDFTSTSAAIFIKGAAGAAASGGMTLISTTTLSGASTTITVAANTYVNLVLIIKSIESAGDVEAYFQLDGFTGGTDYTPLNIIRNPNGPAFESRVTGTNGVMLSSEDFEGLGTNNNYVGYCTIYDANSTIAKLVDCNNFYVHSSGRINGNRNLYTYASTAVVGSIVFTPVGSTWDAGTILLYGVK